MAQKYHFNWSVSLVWSSLADRKHLANPITEALLLKASPSCSVVVRLWLISIAIYRVAMEAMTNLTNGTSNASNSNSGSAVTNGSNENGSQNGSTGSGRSTPSSDSSPGKLFVGGLSWQTTPDKLRDYFGQFGTVTDVLVMKDPVTQVNTSLIVTKGEKSTYKVFVFIWPSHRRFFRKQMRCRAAGKSRNFKWFGSQCKSDGLLFVVYLIALEKIQVGHNLQFLRIFSLLCVSSTNNC